MRDDLPAPVRLELDQQRLAFIRWCGTQFEALVSKGIDPAPWIASVVTSLECYMEDENRAA